MYALLYDDIICHALIDWCSLILTTRKNHCIQDWEDVAEYSVSSVRVFVAVNVNSRGGMIESGIVYIELYKTEAEAEKQWLTNELRMFQEKLS